MKFAKRLYAASRKASFTISPSTNGFLCLARTCSSHASATTTCEQSRPKQAEGKDQASDTYKWPPCTWSCKLLVDKPTRITKHSNTLIDHIYTNDVKSSIVSGIIIDDLSDHLPIFAISEKASPQKVYPKKKVRKINGIIAEHFIADLQSRLNAKLNGVSLPLSICN